MTRGRIRLISLIATLLGVVLATVGAMAVAMAVFPADDTATPDAGGPAVATPDSPSTPSTPPPTTQPPQTPEPVEQVTHEPDPEPEALLAPGDKGLEVRELQSRLKQIAWYAPDVTGRYDDVTVRAVKGFQGKRGLDRTGEVDRRTWKRLLAMTRMPTDDKMHNRLTPGPTIIGPEDSGRQVRELQARLKQIAWYYEDVTGFYGDVTTAAVAGFQAKRGFPDTGEVDQRTWDRLVEMTTTPTADEMHNRLPDYSTDGPAHLDQRCLTGRVLCIDKTTQSLSWVVDGDVETTVDVRFGSELTPTREGVFSVYFKSRDHVSSLFNTSMPFAMFFSGGQAVHYSPDFAANGYNGASHGCVNVRDYDTVAWLFDEVQVGDTVVVYWS